MIVDKELTIRYTCPVQSTPEVNVSCSGARCMLWIDMGKNEGGVEEGGCGLLQ